MKKTLFAMAIAIITAVGISSCGGDKNGETNKGTDATEQTSANATELNYEKLAELFNKADNSELSSADYDFLLEQGEILNNIFKGMSSEELAAFRDNLKEDQLTGIMVIGLGLAGAEKAGKLSDSQLKRYEAIKANDPTKK